MVAVAIGFTLIYLFIGCLAWSLSSNKYDTEDYPLLVIIFWPLMIVVEIFFELKDLLEDIRGY